MSAGLSTWLCTSLTLARRTSVPAERFSRACPRCIQYIRGGHLSHRVIVRCGFRDIVTAMCQSLANRVRADFFESLWLS